MADLSLEETSPDNLPMADTMAEPMADDSFIVAQDMATEEPPTSPVQILSNVDAADGDEDDFNNFIQLGDRVMIESTVYGKTIGRVYYRSEERISVKPDGAGNMLHVFDLEPSDEEETYKEEYGVTSVLILEKREKEFFIEQQHLDEYQLIITFDKEGKLIYDDEETKHVKQYKIISNVEKSIEQEQDAITLEDMNDPSSILELDFNFVGIPPDMPFVMIGINGMEEEKKEPTNEAAEPPAEVELDKAIQEEQRELEEQRNENEDDGIEILGFIEVMKPQIVREAASYEQRIPDDLQRIDALNDFLSGLDPLLQKDENAIRSVRVLVETLLHLKQTTSTYNKDGSIKGPKAPVTFLSDLIRSTTIPLGRPILQVIKKLYTKGANLEEETDTTQVVFEDFREELTQIMQEQAQMAVASTGKNAQPGQEWFKQKSFLESYFSPWMTSDKEAEEDKEKERKEDLENEEEVKDASMQPTWSAHRDSDFFRQEAPRTGQANADGTYTLQRTVEGYRANTIMDHVTFGLERALSTTYHKGEKEPKHEWISRDSADMMAYILFPLQVVNQLGSTRSHFLAIDSGRSQLPIKSMTDILQQIGEPKEDRANSALPLLIPSLSIVEGKLSLKDYVEGFVIPSLGMGDMLHVLEQYGIQHLDISKDVLEVLNHTFERYQSQLLTALAALRTSLSENKKEDPVPNPFLKDPAILTTILAQPALKDAVDDYERINITLSASDLGKVIYLMQHHPNYFQVAAGKNPVLIGRALAHTMNNAYLQQLQIEKILAYNKQNAGSKPKKNPCQHVRDLVSVRRLRDTGDRFAEMALFVRRYQGDTKDFWLNCVICSEHLICMHEFLQLKAFLRPHEKDIIEKEIILGYSGGQFQGKYICKVCGQSIRDLDFDNTIEFDDDGKPKSGRAVLVDADAILEEQIHQMIQAPIETSPEESLGLTEQREKDCYYLIRDLAEYMGVPMLKEVYIRIMREVLEWLGRYMMSERDYNKIRKKKPEAYPEYVVFIARNRVCAAAVYILLEIQCSIPSYVVNHTLMGCPAPGWNGYPLLDNLEDKQGIEYLACGISLYKKKGSVWDNTEYQTIQVDKVRMNTILFNMINILTDAMKDINVQSRIAQKRIYLAKMSTHALLQKDVIYPDFLPEQVVLTPEEAAKEPITKEVLENMGKVGLRGLVKLWIREAHHMATTTAVLNRTSPMIETTCCTTSIQLPGSFWKPVQASLHLPKRALIPVFQGQPMMIPFQPRDVAIGVVEPNPALYYRIFLKYCSSEGGDHAGQPHEPGPTNRCIWCGFQFPCNPAVMDIDKDGKEAILEYMKSKNKDVNKGISPADFNNLLDQIHDTYRVKPIRQKNTLYSAEQGRRVRLDKVMIEFASIAYPPIPAWKEIIIGLIKQFREDSSSHAHVSLKDISNAPRNAVLIVQKQLAASKLMSKYKMTLQMCMDLLTKSICEDEEDSQKKGQDGQEEKKENQENEDQEDQEDQEDDRPSIKEGAWTSFFQTLQSYFIVPFQRILSDFKTKSILDAIPKELRIALSEQHVNDDLVPKLETDLEIQTWATAKIAVTVGKVSTKDNPFSKTVKAKLTFFLNQMRDLYAFKHKIRSNMIPGHDKTLKYIKYTMLYGPLASLLSTSSAARQHPTDVLIDPTPSFFSELIIYTLLKYKKERLAYSDSKIKELIEIRNERERVNVVAEFDKMDEESRRMELTNKSLGLGKWSVGGSKLIRAYDKDYYDQERVKRMEAGIFDFPGLGDNMAAEGRQLDAMGLPMFGDDESGYEHNQHGDDDNE